MTEARALTDGEWLDVFHARCKSKRGERLTEAEQALVVRAHRSDPERYAAQSDVVFEATKPFGATR